MKCPKCRSENPDTSHFCAECGTGLPSAEDAVAARTETMEAPREELTTGATFASRYQIIEELGKGGMGKVYRVLDKKLNEEVALKLIKPEIASDKKTIQRFSNELKIARKIVQKNIARMFDLNEETGTHYITMEYVKGEDLKRLIRKMGQLSAAQTVPIARQVCEGLAEAHRMGVVHRDLKPQNIMVDEEGNARIMDFGIARSIKEKGLTGAGMMIGTPEYMSPEQVEGKETDQRSDIYSLGVILYEMVTGQVPFEGDTPYTIGVKHKSELPKAPREINPRIPEDLNRVVMRCLEKEREKRYKSAGELRAELEGIERSIPTAERVVPERKPLTSREITVQFSLKKLIPFALIGIGLVLIAVLIWQILPDRAAVPLPSDRPSLAIMYFENNTGDENLDHYRKALSDLLIADLSQSKHISVLRGDRLFNILRQLGQLEAESYASDILKQVASRGRATHILQGNYTKAGENYRINVMLHEAGTEELIGSEVVEGKGEESIFSMVDELTRRIKQNFKLSSEEITSDIDEEVGAITTSSPEAFRLYSEGRKYHHTGDFRRSIQLMEKAIAIDPNFAMAYRSMSKSYGNSFYDAEKKKYIKKAFESSAQASERERLLIQGDFYSETEETYDKAIESYTNLLELYPGEETGRTNLAIVFINLEQWDKAMPLLEESVLNRDESPYDYVNLSSIHCAKGQYAEAVEVLRNYLDHISENLIVRVFLAFAYLSEGKFAHALDQADEISSLHNDHFWGTRFRGDILMLQGDLAGAEKEYRMLLDEEEAMIRLFARDGLAALYLLQGKGKALKYESDRGAEEAEKLGQKEWERAFHYYGAYMSLRAGNFEKALEECSRLWTSAVESDSYPWKRYSLHLKGLIHLESGAIDEALSTAEELIEMVEKSMNPKLMRFVFHLRGRIELEKENFSKAVDSFDKALLMLPYQYSFQNDLHALFINSLAFAHYRAGNLDRAQAEYEKIAALTTGRMYYGDLYARSFYMLGKIFEKKGLKARALEHYTKFLDLWENADPGFSEVEDAKRQIKAIGLK